MRYPQRKNKTNIYCQVLVGHFPIQTQRIIAQSKDHLVVIRGVANLVPGCKKTGNDPTRTVLNLCNLFPQVSHKGEQ